MNLKKVTVKVFWFSQGQYIIPLIFEHIFASTFHGDVRLTDDTENIYRGATKRNKTNLTEGQSYLVSPPSII